MNDEVVSEENVELVGIEEVGGKVLIVDDEPINILAISSLLEIQQISSETAEDGNEAIEKVKERIEKVQSNMDTMYEVILLDYSLGGGMDGPEVCRKLREIISSANCTQ